MPNQDKTITPKHTWKLQGCRVGLEDPDTRAWAEYIINNLTKKNEEILSGVLPMMLKHFGWLNEDVAGLFGSVIEDRTKALIDAIHNNKVNSDKYPTLTFQRERHVVGAAICELVAQGHGSDFLNSFEAKGQ